MKKNELIKKIGITTAIAAAFGLVSSGVFVTADGLAHEAAKVPTAITASIRNASGDEVSKADRSEITAPEEAEKAETGDAAASKGADNANDAALSNEAENADTGDAAASKETGNADIGDITSTEEANKSDAKSSGGTMTVSEVAANSMPAMVAITNKSVEDVQDYFGDLGGFGSFGGFGNFGGFGDYYGNGPAAESVSMGTGVIIGDSDDQIIIATNQHVVSSSKELSVAFIDEAVAPASVLGEDPSSDLAVIAVKKSDLSEETAAAIRVITIGSSDELTVGEQVVAIGNALGYGQSVSTGIVSALHRTLETWDGSRQGTDDGLIQTDAAINPGNSGGALLNMKGELIGINSAKYADTDVEGMGYAIPITSAQPILTSLQSGEAVTVSSSPAAQNTNTVRLGISCTGVSKEYSSIYGVPAGVYVKSVDPGSAAANGGIKEGDIITAIDRTALTSVEDLTAALAKYKEGDSAKITVSRLTESKDIFGNDSEGEYQSGTTTVTFGSAETIMTSLNEQ